MFAAAGYRITRSTRTLGALGSLRALTSTPEGYRIYLMGGGPQSQVALAGIQLGDVIVAVDGIPVHQVRLAGLYGSNWIPALFMEKAGERVVLTVARGSTRREVPLSLNRREETVIRIERDPAATPQAIAIRNEWLRR